MTKSGNRIRIDCNFFYFSFLVYQFSIIARKRVDWRLQGSWIGQRRLSRRKCKVLVTPSKLSCWTGKDPTNRFWFICLSPKVYYVTWKRMEKISNKKRKKGRKGYYLIKVGCKEGLSVQIYDIGNRLWGWELHTLILEWRWKSVLCMYAL